MKILLIAIGVVFLIWIISLLIQSGEKRKREADIKKRLEDKKKDEEEEERSPFRR
jgi:hypothetical protein